VNTHAAVGGWDSTEGWMPSLLSGTGQQEGEEGEEAAVGDHPCSCRWVGQHRGVNALATARGGTARGGGNRVQSSMTMPARRGHVLVCADGADPRRRRRRGCAAGRVRWSTRAALTCGGGAGVRLVALASACCAVPRRWRWSASGRSEARLSCTWADVPVRVVGILAARAGGSAGCTVVRSRPRSRRAGRA
jgi:hypothetical protein